MKSSEPSRAQSSSALCGMRSATAEGLNCIAPALSEMLTYAPPIPTIPAGATIGPCESSTLKCSACAASNDRRTSDIAAKIAPCGDEVIASRLGDALIDTWYHVRECTRRFG